MWGLFTSLGKTKRTFKDIPREGNLLLLLIGLYYFAALLSPIWKMGALNHTIDYSKVWVAWILTFLLITDFGRLRQIIEIQAASVAVIATVSIIKGHSQPRLAGVIGGVYSNPNDLAFAMVLTLPFALAFLLTSKGAIGRILGAGDADHAGGDDPYGLTSRLFEPADFGHGDALSLWRQGKAADADRGCLAFGCVAAGGGGRKTV